MAVKKKILIFTDSRGQHKPKNATHKIFAERLAEHPDYEVKSYLCPMKWTTTLDFLSQFTEEQLASYDHVILYTGIVEWSPRKQSNAINDLYECKNTENLQNFDLTTAAYAKKVVNNKKPAFDNLFGELPIKRYLHSPLSTEYEGEKTINMYPLDLGITKVARWLAAIPNLIFINANRILPDWRGDYSRDRPANMNLLHDYSRLFAEEFPENRIVNIFPWTDNEIKKYTCDNLHLTKAGSDWIYDRLIEKLSAASVTTPMRPRVTLSAKLSVVVPVYNVKKWLDKCLISVANQSLKDIEIILVDDGSTDGSADICKAFARKDPRFKYIRQDNRGLGPARNIGITYATTDYVTFIDSDDTIDPDYCRKLYDAIIANDAEVASCMFRRTDENGVLKDIQSNFLAKPIKGSDGSDLSDFEKVLGTYSSSMACCRLFKHSLLEDNNLRFPERVPHEDWFFTYKTLMLAHKSAYVEEPLYFWRNRIGSLSNTANEHHIEAPLLLIEDTYETLSRVAYSPRVIAMADRRAIATLGIIFSRVKNTNPGLLPYLFKRAGDYLDKINEIFRRADRDAIDRDMLGRVGQLIEGIASYKQDAIIKKNKRLNTARSAFQLGKTDHDKILAMRNAFKGERCFIIGNGPTLNNHDMDLLEDEYTFGVNSIFLKTRDTGFMPTFYVVEDSKVLEENVDDIRGYPAPFKFFPEDYKKYELDSPATCHIKLDWDFYFASRPYFKIPRFSCAAHENVFAGQTVTYANMQLAYYMGFSEVYLIGMDFEYYIPPEHKRSGNHILSTTDDPNHFHKDYFGVGKTWKDPRLDRVALSYRQAKLVFEAAERRLANATIGGRLEIFDRVDFEAMLRDPTTGKKRGERITPPIISEGSERGYLTGMASQDAEKDAVPKPPASIFPAPAPSSKSASLAPDRSVAGLHRSQLVVATAKLLLNEKNTDVRKEEVKKALYALPADDSSATLYLRALRQDGGRHAPPGTSSKAAPEFAIFGSCVSRDPFSFSEGVSIPLYCGRQSIASSTSPRASAEFLSQIKFTKDIAAFHQRSIESDISKHALVNLRKLQPHIPVLIDLIDERTPLGVTPENTIVTISQAAQLFSNLSDLVVRQIEPWSSEYAELFRNALPGFAAALGGRKVMIHRALFAQKSDNKFLRINARLREMYDEVQAAIPHAVSFDIPAEFLIGEPNHKWGAAPFHYVDSYYTRTLDAIERLSNVHIPRNSSFSLQRTEVAAT